MGHSRICINIQCCPEIADVAKKIDPPCRGLRRKRKSLENDVDARENSEKHGAAMLCNEELFKKNQRCTKRREEDMETNRLGMLTYGVSAHEIEKS